MVYYQVGSEQVLDQVCKFKDMFLKYFFLQELSKLFEFFEDDLKIVCVSIGFVVEFGYFVEWVWLLDQFVWFDGSLLGFEV